MNHTDLKRVIDNIKIDSMSRDEIFYDSGVGVEERKTLFFQHIRELQKWFDYYLEHEEMIMRPVEDENNTFSQLIKTQNNHFRKTLKQGESNEQK